MESHRRLPHRYPPDRWLFLTWHLHGSLPHSQSPPPAKVSAGQVFVWIDRYLDRSQHGPQFLRQEAVAKLVIAALLSGARLGHFRLGPFVVMGNHLHVLFFPLVPPSRLLKSLKGFTARQANRLLGRTGEPFWQKESYDHWVRSEIEWNRIASYIEENPVKAGLVSRAQDYLWSSAHEEWREGVDRSVDAARVGACATTPRRAEPLG
jgi:REP element-mobilizing transposase RayT